MLTLLLTITLAIIINNDINFMMIKINIRIINPMIAMLTNSPNKNNDNNSKNNINFIYYNNSRNNRTNISNLKVQSCKLKNHG